MRHDRPSYSSGHSTAGLDACCMTGRRRPSYHDIRCRAEFRRLRPSRLQVALTWFRRRRVHTAARSRASTRTGLARRMEPTFNVAGSVGKAAVSTFIISAFEAMARSRQPNSSPLDNGKYTTIQPHRRALNTKELPVGGNRDICDHGRFEKCGSQTRKGRQ